MSKITDIRDLVASSTSNLEDALLQCMVLASQLEYEPLETWAGFEIGGYPSKDTLPDYRIVRTNVIGLYNHPRYNPYMRDVPEVLLPEEIRADAQRIYFFDNIGKLRSLKDDGTLRHSVPSADKVLFLINHKLQEIGGSEFEFFESITRPIPPGSIAGVLTAIRQKTLRFMIELNKLFPDDQTIEEQGPQKTEEITDLFRPIFNINAHNVTIAGNDASVSQGNITVTQVNTGDWRSLEQYLARAGVPADQIEPLRPILERIGNGDESEDIRGDLVEWMGEAAQTVLETGGGVAKEVVVQTLADGILAYLPEAISQGWFLANFVVYVIQTLYG